MDVGNGFSPETDSWSIGHGSLPQRTEHVV
jgi:hypothetical protein